MKRIKLFTLKIIRRYQAFIRSEYQRLQRGVPFIREQRIINVKKGKRRYTLLLIENYNGTVHRFNLGRH